MTIATLLIVLSPSLAFVCAESGGLGRPITSKVIPLNFTAIESGGSESIHSLQPVNTSSVSPSNYSTTPAKVTPPYTVTNATITFLLDRVMGDSTNPNVVSIANSSKNMITGKNYPLDQQWLLHK
jgi:hypothetical protein